jgi:hypothetical protein
VSVYDSAAVGPLKIHPVAIYADFVQVELSVEHVEGKPALEQPYIQDGALYVPVRVWEQVQKSAMVIA